MLLSSLFSVIGWALSGSTGSFRLLQFFSVDVTVESIFRHWSGPLGISWLFSFVPVFQCCCFCRVYFPLLVVPSPAQLAFFRLLQYFSVDVTVEFIFRQWSALPGSTSCFRLFQYFSVAATVETYSAIGRAHSGSTGCFRFLRYFSVDDTVESIFRHLSGTLGLNWRLSFPPVFQC